VNSYAICAAIRENGGIPIFLGIARDNPEEIEERLKEGLQADIVVCSGGTSAGMGDLIYGIINKLGEPGILVHGIAVKPGKPTIIAVVNGKPVFGLPGYPTSALMIFEIFVAPVIRAMAGLSKQEREVIKAKLSGKVFSSMRREFLPVNVVKGKEYAVYPVTGNYSAAIKTLAEADGFIEIQENRVFLEDEEVEVELFSSFKPADLMIIGSHCIGIDLLLEVMRKKYPVDAKVINAGSSGGLSAIRRGEADIAGTHLLDEETGMYNKPFLLKYGLSKKALMVKGYIREQGLIVAKDNPKKVKDIEDMLREDISIINRNPGSGTRMLLDMHLRRIAAEKSMDFGELIAKIRGYSIEAKSHTAVAVAVLMGKADVGIGIKTVASRYGLDFIPLRGEEYDFVIRKERLSKASVRNFIETLRSEEFKKALERLPGMKVTEKTGLIEKFV
jgi:putative molybdopterin biosynthesis protein